MAKVIQGLGGALVVATMLQVGMADEGLYAPVPAAPTFAPTLAPPPLPVPGPTGDVIVGPVLQGPVVSLPIYDNVRVRDRNRIHPAAIPTLVAVCDPCRPGCLVNVEICVPPCECVDVSRRWQGRKVTFDYGDYEIEITGFRSGQIVVDYDS